MGHAPGLQVIHPVNLEDNLLLIAPADRFNIQLLLSYLDHV